jgi:hypothetical protein
VGTATLKLFGQVHEIAQGVLGPRRVEDVAGVADGWLAQRLRLLAHRLDGHGDVRQPIERVEDAENINARGGGLLDEGPHDVVGVVGVADGVGRPQQHLEEDVGHLLTQPHQPIPGRFLQEAHGGVEGRAAPHFQRK